MTNDDRALSWFWGWVLAVVFVLAVAVGCGAPVINSNGLSWDNSAWINAQQQKTERERIQANRDIRIEQERGETVQAFVAVAGQTLVIVAVAVGVAKALPPIVASIATAIATAFAAWAARPHRPVAALPPPHIIIMAQPWLAAMRDSRLEYDEQAGAWVVISDTMRDVHYLEDRHHRS